MWGCRPKIFIDAIFYTHTYLVFAREIVAATSETAWYKLGDNPQTSLLDHSLRVPGMRIVEMTTPDASNP